ncbi:hypothetical protein [Nocardia sienata]|uniref:hypothetical protein n=1 Tax=Nocardia sienata TaxID=248552 RepID=UPI0014725E28|nr:hypothetical protein [Nocardia sienata]
MQRIRPLDRSVTILSRLFDGCVTFGPDLLDRRVAFDPRLIDRHVPLSPHLLDLGLAFRPHRCDSGATFFACRLTCGVTFAPHLLGRLTLAPRLFFGDGRAAAPGHESNASSEACHHDHHHDEHTNADQVETFLPEHRCDLDPSWVGKWNSAGLPDRRARRDNYHHPPTETGNAANLENKLVTSLFATTAANRHRFGDIGTGFHSGPAPRIFGRRGVILGAARRNNSRGECTTGVTNLCEMMGGGCRQKPGWRERVRARFGPFRAEFPVTLA